MEAREDVSSDRPPRPHALRHAVRRALGTGAAIVAATWMANAVAASPRAAFPAVFPLGSLYPAAGGDGSAGFVLTGIRAGDNSGFSVSGAGDLNGDGIDDIVVGAVYAAPHGRYHAGESYVVFGRDTAQTGNFPGLLSLASLLPDAGGDGSEGFVLSGSDPYDNSGRRVSKAGDINGDGLDDILISAPFADPAGLHFGGEAYVVFGRDTARRGNFPPVFPLGRLYPPAGGNGTLGFVLKGISRDDRLGRSLSAAGDLNGDGIDDLVIGSLHADPGGREEAGQCYVVFGRNTAETGNFPAVFPIAGLLPGVGDGSTGFVLSGIDAYDRSGVSATTAGDVNGDGITDLIIGAYQAAPHGRIRAGESYVVFGRDTAQTGNFPAELELSALAAGDGSTGFVVNGGAPYDASGFAVSGAGDVNGDGIDDIVIGAVYADRGGRINVGEGYVVFGRDTAEVGNFPAEFELATLAPGDGSAGFVLKGLDAYDRSGRAVSATGDVNADGIDDFIISAFNASPAGQTSAGESYVIFGRGPVEQRR